MDSLRSKTIAIPERELWSLVRSILEQGRDIQVDYANGVYSSYEHCSARVDEAARERADKLLQKYGTADEPRALQDADVQDVRAKVRESIRVLPEEGRPAEPTVLRADLGNCGEPGSFEKRMETFERVVRTAQPPSVVSGWVIEGAWSSTDRPEYWNGSSLWGTDPYQALRFATEKDAQQAADLMCAGINVRICEHEWAESAPETKEGGK